MNPSSVSKTSPPGPENGLYSQKMCLKVSHLNQGQKLTRLKLSCEQIAIIRSFLKERPASRAFRHVDVPVANMDGEVGRGKLIWLP